MATNVNRIIKLHKYSYIACTFAVVVSIGLVILASETDKQRTDNQATDPYQNMLLGLGVSLLVQFITLVAGCIVTIRPDDDPFNHVFFSGLCDALIALGLLITATHNPAHTDDVPENTLNNHIIPVCYYSAAVCLFIHIASLKHAVYAKYAQIAIMFASPDTSTPSTPFSPFSPTHALSAALATAAGRATPGAGVGLPAAPATIG